MPQVVTVPVGAKGADYVKLTDEIAHWLYENNIDFVARYCVPPESTRIGKAITPAEVRWLHDSGIAILLNWEIHAQDGLTGAAGGKRAGDWLKARAAELGCPTSVPLIASIDTDTYPANIKLHEQYVRAFAAAIAPHPVGIYGDVDIAVAVKDLSPLFWRANAQGWGLYLPDKHPPRHVQQHKALYPPGVDPNTAMAPFTAWLPTPDPIPEPEDDMTRYLIRDKRLGGAVYDASTLAPIGADLFAAMQNDPSVKIIDQDHEPTTQAFLGRLPQDAVRFYDDFAERPQP